MAKKDNKILWIIGLIVLGIILYQYSGFFSTVSPCTNNCNPYYYSVDGKGCYSSCGTAGITSCDTQEVANWYTKNSINAKPFSDSRCTSPLANYKCVENWKCGSYNSCGTKTSQTRTCTDLNNCGTTNDKPLTSRSCGPTETVKTIQINPPKSSNAPLSDFMFFPYQSSTKIGSSISLTYKFGKFVPPVSMDNFGSYKLKQPFKETTTIPFKDYPLGFEMAILQVHIKVKTCSSFPVYFYWYDGNKLIGSFKYTANPVLNRVFTLCNYDEIVSATTGHTGTNGCPNGAQYIDYLGKNKDYTGYCVQLWDTETRTRIINVDDYPEITHLGTYRIVVDTLGSLKTITFQVT